METIKALIVQLRLRVFLLYYYLLRQTNVFLPSDETVEASWAGGLPVGESAL